MSPQTVPRNPLVLADFGDNPDAPTFQKDACISVVFLFVISVGNMKATLASRNLRGIQEAKDQMFDNKHSKSPVNKQNP